MLLPVWQMRLLGRPPELAESLGTPRPCKAPVVCLTVFRTAVYDLFVLVFGHALLLRSLNNSHVA